MKIILIAVITILLLFIIVYRNRGDESKQQHCRLRRRPQLIYGALPLSIGPQPTVPTSVATNAVQSVGSQPSTDNTGRSNDTGIITPMLKPTICTCISGGNIKNMVENSN